MYISFLFGINIIMKKNIIWLFICLMLLTSSLVYGQEINNKLVGKVIIIDVGHGSVDKGTTVENVNESDINLAVALKLREELIKQGVTVLMTRDGNYDLSSPNSKRRKKSDFDNRIDLINNSGADLYLSIHMNYLDNSKYYGAQVFYTPQNEELAKVMQESFKSNLNSPLEAKKVSNNIYMYQRLKVPGLLIECGFLSNSRERMLLQTNEYQEKIVKTIIDGLLNYY